LQVPFVVEQVTPPDGALTSRATGSETLTASEPVEREGGWVGKTAKVAAAVGAADAFVVVFVVREIVEVTIALMVVAVGATIAPVVRTEHLPSAHVPSQNVPHAPQF
jgi:hypothetical protein